MLLRLICLHEDHSRQCVCVCVQDMFKLNQQFERFYTRHAYTPIRDCWERPICSLPGARIDVMDRVSSDGNWTYTLVLQHTLGCVEVFSCMAPHHCSPPPPPSMPGTKRNCLNLGSYNYLGFAENSGPCTEAVKETMKCCGVACCSARGDYGEGRGREGSQHWDRLLSVFCSCQAIFPLSESWSVPLLGLLASRMPLCLGWALPPTPPT